MFENMGIFGIILEYFVLFGLILLISYFFFIKKKTTYNKELIPVELNYLVKLYKINIKNLNYKQFVWIYVLINNFIITTVYIIVYYLVDKLIFKIIIGIILVILMIIICYGILGRIYKQKEGKKNV